MNEEIIFKTCGKGLNGDFPRTVLVDRDKMQIRRVEKPLSDIETVPLRMLIFSMDANIRRELEYYDEIAVEHGKCLKGTCDHCYLCAYNEEEYEWE